MIEAPGGDPTRYTPPVVGGHAATYAGLNFGKRSVVLDLKAPAGREVFEAMVPAADVVVETFRPGVLDRLGLGFEALRALNPRVILCSISGYGQSGPLQQRAGHDLNYVARAGLLGLFGPADGAPPVPGVQMADVGGGALHGAIGVLAALLERDRRGTGCHLDISMARSASAFLALEGPRCLAGEPEPRGAGMLTGGLPCYRVYATADGRHMALGALEPKFFGAFCERAGVPHLAGDGFATGERGAAVASEIAAAFAARTQEEWVALLSGCDCCCEPVRTPTEALGDPEIGAPTVDLGGLTGVRAHVGLPLGTLAAAQTHVASLGEHGRAACADFGVAPALIDAAVAAGALLPGEG
jgi:crotonobetainyl-CoA:carnitine CoA-transferase CaiB-like acyl-CoA transferase